MPKKGPFLPVPKKKTYIHSYMTYIHTFIYTYLLGVRVQLDPVVSLRMKHVHYSANTIHTDTSRTVLESP